MSGERERLQMMMEYNWTRLDLGPLDKAAIKWALDEIDRLQAVVDAVPKSEDVELAIRANNMGGLTFKEDYCQCDPEVGCLPCPYCAIDSVLSRLWKAIDPEAAEAAKGAANGGSDGPSTD